MNYLRRRYEEKRRLPIGTYTVARSVRSAGSSVVQARIKPHDQQEAEAGRRDAQGRVYRRNQVFGLLIAAAVIFLWWVWHTKPGWVLPAGWWRF